MSPASAWYMCVCVFVGSEWQAVGVSGTHKHTHNVKRVTANSEEGWGLFSQSKQDILLQREGRGEHLIGVEQGKKQNKAEASSLPALGSSMQKYVWMHETRSVSSSRETRLSSNPVMSEYVHHVYKRNPKNVNRTLRPSIEFTKTVITTTWKGTERCCPCSDWNWLQQPTIQQPYTQLSKYLS